MYFRTAFVFGTASVYFGRAYMLLTFQYSFYCIGGLLTEQNYNCKQSTNKRNCADMNSACGELLRKKLITLVYECMVYLGSALLATNS